MLARSPHITQSSARCPSRAITPWACAAALAAFSASVAGCPSPATTTLTYTPVTKIVIRSSDLIEGHGCGTGADQIYRYAAIVSFAPSPTTARDAGDAGASAPAIATSVFDCFADGSFENLPAADGGSQEFSILIRAYAFADFPPALACPGGVAADGGVCASQSESAVLGASPPPDWTTTCTATQQQGIPVLAVCGPLVSEDGGSASDGDAQPDDHG
ncbi:MAG: hypothetical protein ACREJ3_13875 [Polyangiaceae bacterium]